MKSGSGKVLVYSINFAPELTGIGKYNGEMVRWLVDKGYVVRVVTGPPYYPQWQVAEGYSASRYARETWQGAVVWRCPIWVPKKATGIKRLLHLFSFAASSLPVLLRHLFWRPDIVFVVEPPLAISPMAVLLAKLFRVKSWLHVQDYEVDAAFELGLLPNRQWLKTAASWLESRLMRGFSVVSSISPPMMRKLGTKRVPPERVRYFPNWADLVSIRPLAEDEPNLLREQLAYPREQVVALYSGSMGAKQGLETVLDAAELLKENTRIRFVLCGEGVAKAALLEQAKRRGLTNVRFLPLQPGNRLNELLNMADIHLLVQKRKSSDLVMPSKLTGMLASGKSVIATAEPETAVYAAVEEAGAGVLVPPEEPDKLAEAIRDLAGRAVSRRSFGRSARRYAEKHLGFEAVMQSFHQSIMELGVREIHESNEKSNSIESI